MTKRTIYLIYELHNGVEPRLRYGYMRRKPAYQKVEELNNRENSLNYYVKEFKVIE